MYSRVHSLQRITLPNGFTWVIGSVSHYHHMNYYSQFIFGEDLFLIFFILLSVSSFLSPSFRKHVWFKHFLSVIQRDFSSVQSLSRVRLFATPWITARQASLSITNSWSSLRLTSIESVMPSISSSVVPFSSCPGSLPASESFPMSQLFAWGGQSTGVSALASFLPKKSQGWCPSEWTGWISMQSKGLSRVFSNTTVQKHQFFVFNHY